MTEETTKNDTRTTTNYLVLEEADVVISSALGETHTKAWLEVGRVEAHGTGQALRAHYGGEIKLGTRSVAVAASSFQPRTAHEKEIKSPVVFR